jgi:hypothetical protein
MNFKFFALLVLVVLFFSNCRKEELDGNTTTSSDYSYSEFVSGDLKNISNEGLDYSVNDPDGKTERVWYLSNGCATISVSPAWPDTTFPKDIIIDFGTGCTGMDGRVRSGKVMVSSTGRYRTPGASWTVTTDDYSINGIAVDAVRNVENQGLNDQGHLLYRVENNLNKITRPDGRSFSYSSIYERSWISGIETNFFNEGIPGIQDDIYWVTGGGSGINSDGNPYSITITDKLVVELDCPHVVSGILEISPDGRPTRILDYGNGDCDNSATVAINDRTFQVILP